MGYLEYGIPLDWKDSLKHVQYVKEHGIIQLINQWKSNRHVSFDHSNLRWGEEVEFLLIQVEPKKYGSSLFSNAAKILEELEAREEPPNDDTLNFASQWHPEFANHMIEAIPCPPYKLNLHSILLIEKNMKVRRAKIQSLLPPNKFVTSQTTFPRFGLKDSFSKDDFCLDNTSSYTTKVTDSIFIPDFVVNPHPRFSTLVKNVIARRTAKPVILIPLYTGHGDITKIVNNEKSTLYYKPTEENSWELVHSKDILDRHSIEKLAKRTINPVKDHIYMDCFGFGMGMCCVQTTWACKDISDARYLYDQMVVLGPIFLALTAATPFQRGLLSDFDVRWPTLEQCVDCRTEKEMETIQKSRYSAVSCYISDRECMKENIESFNDVKLPIDQVTYDKLISAGVDSTLAKHFGYLWVRDPIVIFSNKIELDDTVALDHFENIQSTNWNSVRVKPPPFCPDGTTLYPISWRVEFRTPESQLTDFENAAGVALISIIAQAVLTLDLDLYMPMSYNDKNMHTSWERDAINNSSFFFRRNIEKTQHYSVQDRLNNIAKLSIKDILVNENKNGLLDICKGFVEKNCPDILATFNLYCELYVSRSRGEKLSCAQFLRKCVLKHPLYKNDCVISPIICYDISVLSIYIGFSMWIPYDMFPRSCVQHINHIPLPDDTKLPSLSDEALKYIKFHLYSETQYETFDESDSIIHLWCHQLPFFLN